MRTSRYDKRLKLQDVNNIADLQEYNVKLPNDYVNWNSLHGQIITRKMTDKERERFGINKE